MLKQFSALGIRRDLQESLKNLGITAPTSIQIKTIPVLLNTSSDAVVLAKTGTGKTVAFGLPILQLTNTDSTHIQSIILAPTRELSQQIFTNLESFASNSPDISIALLCGGVPIKPQIERLKKTTHIVVATPGRLVDLIERGAINLEHVAQLVLDEADEMISALKEAVDVIIKKLPKNRRHLLFTATMPGTIKQVVQNYMSKHVTYIENDMETVGHSGIEHAYIVVEPIEKLDVLLHFINTQDGQQGLIFCKTKAAVNKLAKKLAANKFSASALHGSLAPSIRNRVMQQFKDGYIKILVATDLAARGIDVKNMAYVVHYHLPDTYETYVHRSGRTARVGASGLSLSIIQAEEEQDIPDFEQELGIQFHTYKKADPQSIAENNTLIWAKKLFKTKPNKTVSADLKARVKTIFHHLSKEELVEKLLANYLAETSIETTKKEHKTKHS
ncbi:DEAD/DEAH box helicase [Bizionia sediminis]|uniref:DEAD/DEAH box helicase n=1 Tax=Bizionia sediminis TaxID=1737064 RepID=A0ABW5KQ20_9FLAO